MDKWVKTVSKQMMGVLEKKYGMALRDFPTIKTYWHNLNYLLFSAINHSRLYDCPFSPAVMEKMGLIPPSLVCFEKENHTLLKELLTFAVTNTADRPSMALLREQMLQLELGIKDHRLALQFGKTERDNMGSYYTPQKLAKEVVKQALAAMREKGMIQIDGTLRIADLSCGSGEFFRAAQDVLLEEYQIPRAESCKYFWGVDLDPVALQISICDLLEQASAKDWPEIISHFHLGNPLIETEQEASFARKSDLFALGRLYAPEMGVSFKWLPLEGFDLILGNPPWEKIRFEERKFFSNICTEIAEKQKKDDRASAIRELEISWPEVFCWYRLVLSDYSNMRRSKYRHSLIEHSVIGELNTYAMFAELSFRLLQEQGISALIVKSTLVTAPIHRKLWDELMEQRAIKSILLFDNNNRIFAIDARERFIVLTLSRQPQKCFELAAGLQQPDELLSARRTKLTKQDIFAINPFSHMIPNIGSTEDIQELLEVQKRLRLFGDVYPDCHFGRLIHLTAHAEKIKKVPSEQYVPIYEGKFLEQYDARFSTFAGVPEDKKYTPKAIARRNKGNPGEKELPESRFFVHKEFWNRFQKQYPEEFSLCWRSLTSPTNARTTLAMILPTCPTCQSIQMLQTPDDMELLLLLGLFNSLPFDYFVRIKMPGLDLTQSVIRQIPVPPKSAYQRKLTFGGKTTTLYVHIFSYIYALLNTEELLAPLLKRISIPIYRDLPDMFPNNLKKELDKLFAEAYQIDDAVFQKMKETFPKYDMERR